MFDYNHLRQFWTLTKQNQDNEHLSVIQNLQDQKKMLDDKIKQYDKNQGDSENNNELIISKLTKLQEEND